MLHGITFSVTRCPMLSHYTLLYFTVHTYVK
jgi:hypothetical protein